MKENINLNSGIVNLPGIGKFAPQFTYNEYGIVKAGIDCSIVVPGLMGSIKRRNIEIVRTGVSHEIVKLGGNN